MKQHQSKTLAALAFCLFFTCQFSQPSGVTFQFDPDAGLIPSFTAGATVSATSNQKEAWKILDDDPSTHWQSGAPLPEGFISRPDLNVFLNRATELVASRSGRDLANLTDGNLATAAKITSPSGKRTLRFVLKKAAPLRFVSLKIAAAAPVQIQAEGKNAGSPDSYRESPAGVALLGSFNPSENFTLKRLENPDDFATSLILSSDADFEVFEVAALADLPTESVVIDLRKSVPVGTIYAKHFAGENTAAALHFSLSNDGKNWQPAGEADPGILAQVVHEVSPETPARFIKLEYSLQPRDWNKVFCWEVKAYDRNGHFGERPAAQPGSVSLRELLGVNAYYSWGTDKYSDELPPEGGPRRFRPVASHARNYHDMRRDFHAPGETVDFEKLAKGEGKLPSGRLDWVREYKSWQSAGLNVQACLMFDQFDQKVWKNPFQNAYDYAFNFVKTFGARHGNGMVCTVEAGNEPWKYEAETYRQILLGMAKGAKAADPTIEVFPCALQAADPGMEKTDVFKNYMGARIPREATAFLDGINLHAYSWATDKKGIRRSVQPEHAHSSFWEILSGIRWRNQNMPGKKIYLSEWGWDCDGGGEDCSHNECVSEQAAAFYAVRGALIAARLGIERATYFYYANENQPSSLFTRSGLTGSIRTDFQKKLAYTALESLVKLAGDKYFLEVLREDETAWIYLLGNAEGRATHLVAWRPVGGDGKEEILISLKTKYQAGTAFKLDGKASTGTQVALPKSKKGEMNLPQNGAPLLVILK
ncbi:MAG: hypothetical protein AAB316_10315 [Bacteroidota bacterium]